MTEQHVSTFVLKYVDAPVMVSLLQCVGQDPGPVLDEFVKLMGPVFPTNQHVEDQRNVDGLMEEAHSTGVI